MTKRPPATDALVSLSKEILGPLPIVGSLLTEALGVFIPNQRIDRLESYLREVDRRFSGIEEAVIEAAFKDPEFIDILEESFQHAAKSLTEERRRYLAALLESSVSQEGLLRIEKKRLLRLLGDLNDIEVLILRAKAEPFDEQRQTFEEQHPLTRRPQAGITASPGERNRLALYDSYIIHLTRLGLLRAVYRKPRQGEALKFDFETGMLEASSHQATRLGVLLLRVVDLAPTREA